MSPVIQVADLGKKYRSPSRILMDEISFSRPASDDNETWALNGLNFAVEDGQTVGILGRNGAGKSTLIKILTGVTPASSGTFEINGTVFPMIELNAGLHAELSGRENIKFLAAVMGLSPKDVERHQSEIEEFSELGRWLDEPVRTYSTGMQARLSFSVAAFINADIILMDEVLGVGDLSFYEKSLKQLDKLMNTTKAVMIVSHSLHHIRRLCNKVLVLDEGRQVYWGDAAEGVEFYANMLQTQSQNRSGEFSKITGRPSFNFVGASLMDAQLSIGDGGNVLSVGDNVDLAVRMTIPTRLDQVTIHIVVENIESVPVIWSSQDFDVLEEGQQEISCRWEDVRLGPGRFTIRMDVMYGRTGNRAFRFLDLAEFVSSAHSSNMGIYLPEFKIRKLT